ncbi:MAG: formylglycine-generating enzyme family protein [Thiotrichaceae bacterium]|nr:formylglycine-generating enzyme family protein [Thiotrichaceae bacterium]
MPIFIALLLLATPLYANTQSQEIPVEAQLLQMNIAVESLQRRVRKLESAMRKQEEMIEEQQDTLKDLQYGVTENQIAKKIFQEGRFHDNLQNGNIGPDMVWIPPGRFEMGSVLGQETELPVHRVSVKQFAMGRYEVTFAEYDQFANAVGRTKPSDEGWGRGNRPVINISWYDAIAYTQWLSEQTGQNYRLPTEKEWEYAARAGSITEYWWDSDKIGVKQALCDGCGSSWDNEKTAPVGSFAPNPFDLYDTVGNVGEWTCSEYENKYEGKEELCLLNNKEAERIAIRSGNVFDLPTSVRSASRFWWMPAGHFDSIGLRVVRE